jgi:transposase-like protein
MSSVTAGDNTPRKHRGRGRPTKYAAILCGVVAELVRDGASTWRIAREIRVSRPTLYAWAKLHPEFREAIGQAISLPATTASQQAYPGRQEARSRAAGRTVHELMERRK